MNKKLEKLVSEAKFIRDEKMRKKINLFVEANRLNNVQQACLKMGLSRNFYYYWLKKLEASGWTLEALKESSRCPKKSPRKSPQWKEDLVLQLRAQSVQKGSRPIAALIKREYRLEVHHSTVGKIFKRNLKIQRQEKKTRKAHPKRYNLPNPGDCIQMDIKYIPYRIGAQQYYLFNAIDDCTRRRFGCIYENKGVWETADFVRKLLKESPFKIKKIQTDNGAEFTNKFLSDARCIGKAPKEHILDTLCQKEDILHKLIPVGECELNGKVERSHKTDDVEFFNTHKPFKSLASLRRAHQSWINFYNTKRVHSSLDYMTPSEMLNFKLYGTKPDWMDLSQDVFIDDDDDVAA